MDYLKIIGARQHNLKNINVSIPKNSLSVFTGVSGSGKSSLAFDTIYAEGQRRYVESLSSYARQFLGIMDKPDVDAIIGLSPAISIDQKATSHNPRSTVGTVTEIYDYMRLLFARIGHPHCPKCGREIEKLSRDQIVTMILDHLISEFSERPDKKYLRFFLLSPVVRDRKGEYTGLLKNLLGKGFTYARVDKTFIATNENISLIKTNRHSLDAVVDRFVFDKKLARSPDSELKRRLTEAVETALTLSSGTVTLALIEDAGFSIPDKPKKTTDTVYSEHFSCPIDGTTIPELEPRSFSFNSPHGACPTCTGIGVISTVDPTLLFAPELSIREGGVIPYAKMFSNDTWYARVVETVASIHDINLSAPIKLLSPKDIQILLNGTGDQLYEVHGKNRFGESTVIHETFGGLVPELLRRYRESKSDWVKTEIEKFMREETCPSCKGTRLKPEALTVTISGNSIAKCSDYSIRDAKRFYESLQKTLGDPAHARPGEKTIATPILKEIIARLTFLIDVGLTYLTISRGARTLSGGEAQRIRLASQIGSGLSGVLYVLDEPSIGLHQKDNDKLIGTLKSLRDLGNTVIVVEHDRDMMNESDRIFDFGPGAGDHGGMLIAEGTPEEISSNAKSLTGKYLSNARVISRPKQITDENNTIEPGTITVKNATGNNLHGISVEFPLGKLICITGVSGSGKSTLVVDTLWAAVERHFFPHSKVTPLPYDKIEGLENIDKSILIDQSPIGRTSRSNPATYTGVFTPIRELFSMIPEARSQGYSAGRFSFNIKGGRCEACEGEGQRKIEMQFLSDVYVTCDVCHGKRYNDDTLSVLFHGKNISDILNLTVEEAITIFTNYPHVKDKLVTLAEVGLSYIKLGQPAPTLSGGEAQRIKLANELSKRATGKTLYILDEPTTGLHFADLEKLLHVLHKLTTLGNTVIVIEHNLDIIKNADHIIDLGPEGGDEGGSLVAAGTPHFIAGHKTSYTGKYLKQLGL